jgi:hypothetical protein
MNHHAQLIASDISIFLGNHFINLENYNGITWQPKIIKITALTSNNHQGVTVLGHAS